MHRLVRLFVDKDDTTLDQHIPSKFEPYFHRKLERPGDYPCHYYWKVYEPDWEVLSSVRQFLREEWEVEPTETWSMNFTREEFFKKPGLFKIRPQTYTEARQLSDRVRVSTDCKECNKSTYTLKDDRRLELKLDMGHPPLFCAPKSLVVVMETWVWDRLQAEELDIGVTADPVDVQGASDADLVMLRVEEGNDLGWPHAPYGEKYLPCKECGHGLSALYTFYHVFEESQKREGWYSWAVGGRGTPLATRDVYRRLREIVREGAGDRLPEEWFQQTSTAFGWYPEERDIAVLPEEYHDPVLDERAHFRK